MVKRAIKVLFEADAIAERNASLVDEIKARDPENLLVIAVLKGSFVFADADAWFGSTNTDDPLSFVHICYALALDPSFIRAGLRRWCSAGDRNRVYRGRSFTFPFAG